MFVSQLKHSPGHTLLDYLVAHPTLVMQCRSGSPFLLDVQCQFVGPVGIYVCETKDLLVHSVVHMHMQVVISLQ